MANINILNLSIKELENSLTSIGEQKFRASQIFNWIYKKNILDLDLMSNLTEELRSKLKLNYNLILPQIYKTNISKQDNSYKFLLQTQDNNLIESILMLEKDRVTLCVSCMIGCPLKCKFCASGNELKFKRNLNTAEIIGQFIEIQNFIVKNNLAKKITNIVFMGMGEPLLNLENIEKAIELLTNEQAFALSKSRITISTAGIINGLSNFINKWGVKLAVSLHFPTQEQRSEFMPISKTNLLKNLITELKKIKLNKRDYITIEYLMLKDINDSLDHAKKLVNLLSTLKIKINLIPYNPIESFKQEPSSEKQINIFANYLKSKNIFVSVRRSRGQESQGACGQFALKE